MASEILVSLSLLWPSARGEDGLRTDAAVLVQAGVTAWLPRAGPIPAPGSGGMLMGRLFVDWILSETSQRRPRKPFRHTQRLGCRQEPPLLHRGRHLATRGEERRQGENRKWGEERGEREREENKRKEKGNVSPTLPYRRINNNKKNCKTARKAAAAHGSVLQTEQRHQKHQQTSPYKQQ